MSRFLKRLATLEAPPPWGIGTVITSLLAAIAAIVVGTTLAFMLFGTTALATIAGWAVGMLIIIAFVIISRSRPDEREALGLGATESALPIVLLLSLGVAITLDLVGLAVTGVASPVTELLIFFGGAPGTGVTIPFAADAFAWIVAIMLLVLFQPLAEELMFRGLIYPALRTGLGAWVGFFATAILYAAFHLFTYTTTPQSNFPFTWYVLLLPLLNGLYLTAVRAYTRSTRAAIVAHVGLGIFAILRALVLAG